MFAMIFAPVMEDEYTTIGHWYPVHLRYTCFGLRRVAFITSLVNVTSTPEYC